MEMAQIHNLVNDVTTEILGESGVINEDLSNVVDVGTAIINAGSVDHYAKSMVDHIGRVICVDRVYFGSVPSILMDSWEYGAILEKITCDDMPDATANESWELENGVSYDPNIFYKPEVSTKFFDKRVTFEIPRSFTEMQAKSSLSNAAQMSAFISMLYTSVNNSMTVKVDGAIMRTINNMIAETFYDMNSGGTYTGAGNNRCINLLKLYNDTYNKSQTVAGCFYDADFIRFAAYTMGVVKSRLTKISTLFNIGGKPRFTPENRLHFVAHSDFMQAADVFLQSGTFHEQFTRMPKAEMVPYWQGSGTSYAVTSTTAIDVKTGTGHNVSAGGILGVMFDRDSLGVSCMNKRTTSQYNPKAEFFNNWFKMDCGFFNDFNENFVVFYVAA